MQTVRSYDWRLITAALACSAAAFVALVLLTRLPVASAPPRLIWTLITPVAIGGLWQFGLRQFAASPGQTKLAEIEMVLVCMGGLLTAAATLATSSRGGSGQVLAASVLSILPILWSARRILLRPQAQSQLPEQKTEPTAPKRADSQNEFAPPCETQSPGTKAVEIPVGQFNQSSTRYLADGLDCLEACVRIHFDAGQQTAVVHIPIQPAMAQAPEVECEPAEDADLRITADPIFPYGVRLVCRRPGPWTNPLDSSVSVLLTTSQLAVRAA